ncbi:hypothetical protein [Salinilacihabitans rarus]|uniref:hypothetical protein n=1 Tax=Salinilacihabitans rarus TaxID=2961596 RepID=UPI0020C8E4B4|nr:hypothetical protein [Salinilacihabitans rarus]
MIAAEQLASENVDVDMAWAPGTNLADSFGEQAGENGDYWYGPSPWATTVDSEDGGFGSASEFISTVEDTYGYEQVFSGISSIGSNWF